MSAEDDFRNFVVARGGSMGRTAYLLTGDHQLAEDLLQTTLAKVYLAWERIREPYAIEAYARRTLVTTYTSWWRRGSSHERPTSFMPEQRARTDDLDERADLWRELQNLPRQQRAIVVLRFYEDLSVTETAAALGIGVGTVKSYTSRALAALRLKLAEGSQRTTRVRGVTDADDR